MPDLTTLPDDALAAETRWCSECGCEIARDAEEDLCRHCEHEARHCDDWRDE